MNATFVTRSSADGVALSDLQIEGISRLQRPRECALRELPGDGAHQALVARPGKVRHVPAGSQGHARGPRTAARQALFGAARRALLRLPTPMRRATRAASPSSARSIFAPISSSCPSRCFDVIIHSHVLEHLRCDPEKVLGEFERILAPEGSISVGAGERRGDARGYVRRAVAGRTLHVVRPGRSYAHLRQAGPA